MSKSEPQLIERLPIPAPEERWFWWIVAGCLILQALLAVDCARQWTPTHDEYWHLPIGLRMWKSGRFDDDVINPPPVRLWAAIPLVLGGANPGDVDSRLDVGDIGDAFWKANGNRARFWFLLGRLMIIPLASITGLAIAWWSRMWFGVRAGLISTLLWTCCPTALANSAIVTHDLPLAAVWTLTLLSLVRFAANPSYVRALVFGALLGLAPLIKLTGIILGPLSVILWFVLRLRGPGHLDGVRSTVQRTPAGPSRREIVMQWSAALAMSLFVIHAGYLFREALVPLGELKLASSQMKALQHIGIGWLPVPAPRDFIAAVDRLAQDLERQHPVYLDGAWSDRPFAMYYAAALSYKLPLSTLALVLMVFCSQIRPGRWKWIVAGLVAVGAVMIFVGLGWIGFLLICGTVGAMVGGNDRRSLFLLTGAVVLPILASGSSNQIGIRYVLPTIPLVCVFAGQAATWLAGLRCASLSGRWAARLTWLAVLAAPCSLRFHPHHLAYFNQIGGGPAGGRWHLVDSNLDWGQDLHALKEYLDRHQIRDVGLAYFGTVIPATVGIDSHFPERFPRPGWYAISANFVQGRPHALRDSKGDRTQVGIEEFGYFRFFEPKATIGYSIYVYQLTPTDVARYGAALQQLQRESQGR